MLENSPGRKSYDLFSTDDFRKFHEFLTISRKNTTSCTFKKSFLRNNPIPVLFFYFSTRVTFFSPGTFCFRKNNSEIFSRLRRDFSIKKKKVIFEGHRVNKITLPNTIVMFVVSRRERPVTHEISKHQSHFGKCMS